MKKIIVMTLCVLIVGFMGISCSSGGDGYVENDDGYAKTLIITGFDGTHTTQITNGGIYVRVCRSGTDISSALMGKRTRASCFKDALTLNTSFPLTLGAAFSMDDDYTGESWTGFGECDVYLILDNETTEIINVYHAVIEFPEGINTITKMISIFTKVLTANYSDD